MAVILSRCSNTAIKAIQGPSYFLGLLEILNNASSWAIPTPRRHAEAINIQIDIHFKVYVIAYVIFLFGFLIQNDIFFLAACTFLESQRRVYL